MTTPAAAFDRDNEMFGPEEPVTRSAVLAQITERQRELRFLEQDRHELFARLAELQEDLRYAVCDHPDTSGFRCDHCGQFADPGEEFWDAQDRFNSRLDEVQQLPLLHNYTRYLIRRPLLLQSTEDYSTLLLSACL